MPKRVDANQKQMVKALKECGLHVLDMHELGKGAPDLAVSAYNRKAGKVEILFVEVKNGKGKLTPDEEAWHAGYPLGGPLLVAREAADVLVWFGMVRGGDDGS